METDTWALIFGLIGTVTGVTSFAMQCVQFWNDRARLSVETKLVVTSNQYMSDHHFRLEVLFRNSGRQGITIVEGYIELPPDAIPPDGLLKNDGLVPVSVRLNLINGQSGSEIVIEGGNRHLMAVDPFFALPLKKCGETATAVFLDALGNEYRSKFSVPTDYIEKYSLSHSGVGSEVRMGFEKAESL